MGNCWGTKEGSTGKNGTGSHDSMHQGIVRERNLDVYEKYEEGEVLGQGSMGHVAKVQVKEGQEGGSAFNPKKKGGFALKHGNRVKKSTSSLSERRGTKVDYALKSILLDRVSQQFVDELSNEIDILKTMVCTVSRIYVVRAGGGMMVGTSKYGSDTLDPFVCILGPPQHCQGPRSIQKQETNLYYLGTLRWWGFVYEASLHGKAGGVDRGQVVFCHQVHA